MHTILHSALLTVCHFTYTCLQIHFLSLHFPFSLFLTPHCQRFQSGHATALLRIFPWFSIVFRIKSCDAESPFKLAFPFSPLLLHWMQSGNSDLRSTAGVPWGAEALVHTPVPEPIAHRSAHTWRHVACWFCLSNWCKMMHEWMMLFVFSFGSVCPSSMGAPVTFSYRFA